MSAGTSIAAAGDAEVGKARFQQVCSECHELADFKGQSEADLKSKLTDIVAGKIQHKKKLQLTDAEIAGVAAFLSAGK